MNCASVARIATELLHAWFWIYLTYAVFCYPKQKLPLVLVLLLAIPVIWMCLGDCPFTILENKLRPLSHSELVEFGTRNRIGMCIRRLLQVSVHQWDSVLSLITLLLVVCVIYRLCGNNRPVSKVQISSVDSVDASCRCSQP